MGDKKELTMEEQMEIKRRDIELQDRVKIDRKDDSVRYTSEGIERDYETEIGIITVIERIRGSGEGDVYCCEECGLEYTFDEHSSLNGRCEGCNLVLREVNFEDDLLEEELDGEIPEHLQDIIDDFFESYMEDLEARGDN